MRRAQLSVAGRPLLVAGMALLLLPAPPAEAQFQVRYNSGQRLWSMQNSAARVEFQMTAAGNFEFRRFRNLQSGDEWTPPADRSVSPIRFQADGEWFNHESSYKLIRQSARSGQRSSYLQTIELQDHADTARVVLELELYQNLPVLRYRFRYQNLKTRPSRVTVADMLPWAFDDRGKAFRAFYVNQWVDGGRKGNFETFSPTLRDTGQPTRLFTGAYGQHCSWLALRDEEDRGVIAGWEFDGRADAAASRLAAQNRIELSATIRDLSRPVAPNAQFQSPWAFIGLFHGDWDDAGHLTQRFSELALAPAAPEAGFPYVMWDSWKYQTDINEQILRRNAEIAASLGVEVFVVDLGWARHIGDWYPDPKKFPTGLRPLSDYVHSLGMKFGLHIPFAEASPNAPVLKTNPDWRSTKAYGYFEADSLCLAHQPVRTWVINQIIRMIDEYQVDWILQDGENMVKECTKTTHTHDPADSNFANAVDGLNAVLATVQARRPNVHWENCQDGGNMMTFNMVRNYVTSIAADDSGPMTTRQAIHGVTYPFSPRYADRYMPEEQIDVYVTRSFMFGGPWILMNRLPAMARADLDLLASEIRVFKSIRERIREGKVYHLTARPAENRIDAIQSYHAPTDTAVAFVFRPEAAAATYRARLRGLNPDRTYRVRFQDSRRSVQMTGRQILEQGIRVDLPSMWNAEIVYAEPLP